MTEFVLSETRDRVAILTLNRPDKLNALNYALIDRMLSLLDQIETDDGVGAVILTGAGERAFSAGADIHEFSLSVAEGTDVALRDFVVRGQRLTARLEAFRKPVIAAVNGLAFGGGCEITEAVPLAIASDRALFAKPEIKLAMPPTFGGTQRLPRLAGRKRALELLLTGDAFSPARALELGLVNQVVPHGQLMPAALDLARRIVGYSQAAVASILTAVARGLDQSIAEALLVEAEQFARMAPTADLREGLSAWRERRKPIYDGTWMHIARPAGTRRAAR
ncbi:MULTISPECIES: crotonase/enoyl-CoA hydratase family protein [unclassified Mesorhizobium]|uniref:crotonase/enoyl-CoA hydratase family protein n=1 Tax=unclassified Mesorhizobium TaxID=325217 RepID=UPI001129DDF7|nr:MULTISPECIES: crotonase/enoyl-CoA hydratase family protein [unclassified Mesorhizobium]TPL00229.1 crotonase/enoyl-CoA hydratase family protein [Mesorhizobium sp. B2-4-16]TPL66331.1 crotonase/enoyl-CoA hydratase family protein [Mesorhizobium sp. B2-4-3]